MIVKTSIDFYGITLEVEAEYKKGISAVLTADPYYSNPPESDTLDVYKIFCNGKDIKPVVDNQALLEIEDLVFEEIIEEATVKL